LCAGLSAWLLHAALDDFDRFWPSSVAFWLIAALGSRSFSAQTTHTASVTRPAPATALNAKDRVPLLTSTAQSD
jgi:hypothetical protein